MRHGFRQVYETIFRRYPGGTSGNPHLTEKTERNESNVNVNGTGKKELLIAYVLGLRYTENLGVKGKLEGI